MKVMGVDPSSHKTGIAVIESRTEKLLFSETWNANKLFDIGHELLALEQHLSLTISQWRVQRAVIERVSVNMNLDTIRKIAYFEGAAMAACSEAGVEIVQTNVSGARKRVIGKNVPKALAIKFVREKYGQQLSADECDAAILALAYDL